MNGNLCTEQINNSLLNIEDFVKLSVSFIGDNNNVETAICINICESIGEMLIFIHTFIGPREWLPNS